MRQGWLSRLGILMLAAAQIAGCNTEDSGDGLGGPALSFTNPAEAEMIQTPDIVISISGKAASVNGVESVEWQNDRGGKGSANGTENWVTGNIVLQLGTNNITITAVDAVGESVSKSLTIERENTSPTAVQAEADPRIMYSYSSSLSNAAPVSNAALLRQGIFFFVDVPDSWTDRGIRSIQIECCLGVNPSGGSYSQSGQPTDSPWRSFFDLGRYGADETRRVRFQATFDDGSRSSTYTADFRVTGGDMNQNSAPVISGRPQDTATVGNQYNFRPSASDPDGDTLQFSISGKPSWALFSSTTGRLFGTPPANSEGSYRNIVISVSDGRESVSLAPFTIDVESFGSGAATLTWTIPTQRTDSSPLTNLAGFNIYYGQTPGDYGNKVTLDNPGLSNYVVDNLSTGRWYFVITAFDRDMMESNPSNEELKTF
jgi:hypothetical protein